MGCGTIWDLSCATTLLRCPAGLHLTSSNGSPVRPATSSILMPGLSYGGGGVNILSLQQPPSVLAQAYGQPLGGPGFGGAAWQPGAGPSGPYAGLSWQGPQPPQPPPQQQQQQQQRPKSPTTERWVRAACGSK